MLSINRAATMPISDRPHKNKESIIDNLSLDLVILILSMIGSQEITNIKLLSKSFKLIVENPGLIIEKIKKNFSVFSEYIDFIAPNNLFEKSHLVKMGYCLENTQIIQKKLLVESLSNPIINSLDVATEFLIESKYVVQNSGQVRSFESLEKLALEATPFSLFLFAITMNKSFAKQMNLENILFKIELNSIVLGVYYLATKYMKDADFEDLEILCRLLPLIDIENYKKIMEEVFIFLLKSELDIDTFDFDEYLEDHQEMYDRTLVVLNVLMINAPADPEIQEVSDKIIDEAIFAVNFDLLNLFFDSRILFHLDLAIASAAKFNDVGFLNALLSLPGAESCLDQAFRENVSDFYSYCATEDNYTAYRNYRSYRDKGPPKLQEILIHALNCNNLGQVAAILNSCIIPCKEILKHLLSHAQTGRTDLEMREENDSENPISRDEIIKLIQQKIMEYGYEDDTERASAAWHLVGASSTVDGDEEDSAEAPSAKRPKIEFEE